MNEQLNPMAPHHLPFYLAPESGTDVLMVVMGILLVVIVLWVGTLYWRLHSLPERMAHKSQKLQFEIVASWACWRFSRTSICSGWQACCLRLLISPISARRYAALPIRLRRLLMGRRGREAKRRPRQSQLRSAVAPVHHRQPGSPGPASEREHANV